MTQATVEAVVRWQDMLGDKDALEITFHGGEPLVPGIQFYRMALPLLRQGLAPRRVRFAMQSNLWLLTNELCDLFRDYGVSLGTSLAGPESINDAQRGQGYFHRTLTGIERARAHGLDVGCICTFTAQSAPHAQEIFDFFCQRFAGMPEYRLGNVHAGPSPEMLTASPVWRMFQARQAHIAEVCNGCTYLDFCRGGCPYNVLAANGGDLTGFAQANLSGLRDPDCPAYQRTFSAITDRAIQEVFSEENLAEVVRRADPEKGLLWRGRLISIMRDGPHPYETAQHARRLLAATASGGVATAEQPA